MSVELLPADEYTAILHRQRCSNDSRWSTSRSRRPGAEAAKVILQPLCRVVTP